MNDCESCIHYPPSASDGKPLLLLRNDRPAAELLSEKG